MIIQAMREGQIEPGELTATAVLHEAGGSYGLEGISRWCGDPTPHLAKTRRNKIA